MKPRLIIAIMGLTLLSCKKEKTRLSFNDKQLAFVNYSKGQVLKFMDTASVLQTLEQSQFRRGFHEQIGFYGKTGNLIEEYEVSYYPAANGTVNLYVSLDASQAPSLNLTFASYQTIARPDSLNYAFSTLPVNGKVYTDVYTLKMYKDGHYINNNDTATLFHNRQFGVIQLLFPNGKKIVRVD
jgi:hypothetical protein